MSAAPPVLLHPDAERYAAAVDALSSVGAVGAVVPALLPSDPDVAARWAEVAGGLGPPVPPRPGARVVVCRAGWAEGPATVLATMSGSRLVVVGDLAAAADEVAAAAEPAAVVVCAAADLTVAAIMRIDRACVAAGRTWGAVTGRGLPELAFAVAKTVLATRPDVDGSVVVDAPSHREAENRATEPVIDRLTERTLFALIRSHGEGGHAKLSGTVVCGLLDDTEFAEHPGSGCSRRRRRCKRARPDQRVLFAGEIRAAVVAFVCCNGFNVAGELYPSPVSMALGMTEGWVAALISPVRPIVAPDGMVARLQELLHAGVPFGEVVARLNELGDRLGQPHAFVLHGDPCRSLPVTGGGAPAGPVPTAPGAGDDWTLRALAQTERGARLLRSVRAWLGGETPAEVDDLERRLARVAAMLLNMLKWAESLPSAESIAAQARSRFLAGSALSAWDRSVCALLLEAREIFDAYDLGHYDQQQLAVVGGPPCARCGTPTEIATFGGFRGDDDLRRAESCVICGPIGEGRIAGLRLTVVGAPRSGRPGEEYTLRVRVEVPPAGPVARSVHLRMRFFDKAAGGCVADQGAVVPAADQHVEFGFTLPEGLGVDLHSVRVVAASGCDVAYARARFVGQPAATAP